MRWERFVQGLGIALDTALNTLYRDRVGLVLFTIPCIVVFTEIVSTSIRSRII
jgi:phosphonate transport system permease protein